MEEMRLFLDQEEQEAKERQKEYEERRKREITKQLLIQYQQETVENKQRQMEEEARMEMEFTRVMMVKLAGREAASNIDVEITHETDGTRKRNRGAMAVEALDAQTAERSHGG